MPLNTFWPQPVLPNCPAKVADDWREPLLHCINPLPYPLARLLSHTLAYHIECVYRVYPLHPCANVNLLLSQYISKSVLENFTWLFPLQGSRWSRQAWLPPDRPFASSPPLNGDDARGLRTLAKAPITG